MPSPTLRPSHFRRCISRLRRERLRKVVRPRVDVQHHTTTASSPVQSSNEAAANGQKTSFQHEASKPIVQLCDLIPLDQFSNSIYSVPVLMLLRLFYQAAPFPMQHFVAPKHVSKSKRACAREITSCGDDDPFLDTYRRITTSDFLTAIQSSVDLGANYKIRSLTWVKALASPLSHEYIQFIVQEEKTGKRRRLAVERSEWGDVVTVGWDWASGEYASHHHILPLPLLTLSFEECALSSSPGLQQFAQILSKLSRLRPYSLARAMCWWYAERVFIATAKGFSDGTITYWPYAKLRYSFIVKTEWIQRPKLVEEAEHFRASNIRRLDY